MNMASVTTPFKRFANSISIWDLPRYRYTTHCGSIMTGTDRFFVHHPNGYGNCSWQHIFLLEGHEKKNPECIIMELLRFSEMIEGVGYVYDGDVPGEACPLFELDGKYKIYLVLDMINIQPTGNVLIQKVE